MTDPLKADVAAALRIVPSIPCEGEAPVFDEPWQAQAFAMTLALQQKGVFTWHEWAETLGEEIQRARREGDPDDGHTYYHRWLASLEKLVAQKGIASPTTLHDYAHAWERAAHRTPHGAPIELKSEDFR